MACSCVVAIASKAVWKNASIADIRRVQHGAAFFSPFCLLENSFGDSPSLVWCEGSSNPGVPAALDRLSQINGCARAGLRLDLHISLCLCLCKRVQVVSCEHETGPRVQHNTRLRAVIKTCFSPSGTRECVQQQCTLKPRPQTNKTHRFPPSATNVDRPSPTCTILRPCSNS